MLIQALLSTFFAILFLQSGIDKVIDRKGNLEWLTGHFARSPLAGMVPMLLSVITLVEISAGLASAVGVVEVVAFRSFTFPLIGTSLSAASLLMLFFGQRMAKDYAGAGGLVPYFIVAIINLYILA
ncbi:MAG: DoxX family protein [Flavobacteriales bacterium]|nr:DoxX family protein [Flavobacteriales bacterium]